MAWPIVTRILRALVGCMMLAACSSVPDLKFDDSSPSGGVSGGMCPSEAPSNAIMCCKNIPCGGPGCTKPLCGLCTGFCPSGTLCCMDADSSPTCTRIDGTCPQ